MRSAIFLLLLPTIAIADTEPVKTEPAKASTTKHAEVGEPLWEVELQLGYGISKRGSEEMTETAVGPMSFAALASIVVNEEPRVFAFGGLVGEALSRQAIGLTAGARLHVPGLPMRVGGGGVWMVAPKTLWGATASTGACWGKGTLGLCGDVQLTAYFAGTALPKDELELQVALVVGVVARGGM